MRTKCQCMNEHKLMICDNGKVLAPLENLSHGVEMYAYTELCYFFIWQTMIIKFNIQMYKMVP